MNNIYINTNTITGDYMKKLLVIVFLFGVLYFINTNNNSFVIRVVSNSNETTDIKEKEQISIDIISFINNNYDISKTSTKDIKSFIENNNTTINEIIKKHTTKTYKLTFKEIKIDKIDNNISKSSYGLEILLGEAKGSNIWCNIYKKNCVIKGKNITYDYFFNKRY